MRHFPYFITLTDFYLRIPMMLNAYHIRSVYRLPDKNYTTVVMDNDDEYRVLENVETINDMLIEFLRGSSNES